MKTFVMGTEENINVLFKLAFEMQRDVSRHF